MKREMRKLIFFLKNFFLPTWFNGNLPYSLRPKALAVVVVLAILIKSVSFVSWLVISDLPFFADISSGLVVYLSNEERQSAGLEPLKENPVLDQAAKDKALDMLAKNYFSHNSPEGVSPWYWFNKNNYAYKFAGENLAVDFFESKDVVDAWMGSPTHKFNILNNNYQEVGVAVVKGSFQGRETTLIVQLFGTPKTKISQAPAQSGAEVPALISSPAVSLKPSLLPSLTPAASSLPSVSPVVAGEETVLPTPAQASPTPSLEPVFAGLVSDSQLPKNPVLTEKIIELASNPSPVLFGLVGYLALSLLLGIFTKIYTPYPKVLYGAVSAMALIVLINYLPGVETVFNLTARII